MSDRDIRPVPDENRDSAVDEDAVIKKASRELGFRVFDR